MLRGFKEFSSEKDRNDPRQPYHLTTTTTCIRSLIGCPEEFWPEDITKGGFLPNAPKEEKIKFSPEELAKKLAKRMLNREQESHNDWTSYSSAGLYTRCHALPLIIKHAGETRENLTVISEHLYRVFWQMHCDPDRMGIGEETVEIHEESNSTGSDGTKERHSLEVEWGNYISEWDKKRRLLDGSTGLSSFSEFMMQEEEDEGGKEKLKYLRLKEIVLKNRDNENSTIWLPVNAFHTYWAMEALRQYREFCKSKEFEGLISKHEAKLYEGFEKRIDKWTRAELARQIYLHQEESPHLDSDQLAWLLAIYVRFCKNIWYRADDRGLIHSGLNCLFKTQLSSGVWRTYRPIFHYKHAGDAYCYMFETLGELLEGCWQQEAHYLRRVVRDHAEELLKLATYAYERRIKLASDPHRAVGWTSGHRLKEEPAAEAWATASVFTFFHQLRRLFAVWTKEVAILPNNLRKVSRGSLTSQEAIQIIADRGNTWVSFKERERGGLNVAEELLTLFVYPNTEKADKTWEPWQDDPAKKLIDNDQPRSAILFGPPGTSKTSLAKYVAYALGWRFVEIRAGDFIEKGYREVAQTAYDIFSFLMELDHCVVLFDEIDELVRERAIKGVSAEAKSAAPQINQAGSREEKQGTQANDTTNNNGEQSVIMADMFARFLTTSMLPMLAELYEQRKIIYFVATNHIGYFDEAIKRSRRFDARIFVPAPSYAKKGLVE